MTKTNVLGTWESAPVPPGSLQVQSNNAQTAGTKERKQPPHGLSWKTADLAVSTHRVPKTELELWRHELLCVGEDRYCAWPVGLPGGR